MDFAKLNLKMENDIDSETYAGSGNWSFHSLVSDKKATLHSTRLALQKAKEKLEKNPNDYQLPVLIDVLQESVIQSQNQLIELLETKAY